MKIAVVTDDHRTISAHFGRAAFYDIYAIEDGKVVGRQSLPKTNHQHANPDEPHHEAHRHNHDHNAMLEPIMDCQVLLAGGMGTGAYNALKIRSIETLITDIREIEAAVIAYLAGTLVNHFERLH